MKKIKRVIPQGLRVLVELVKKEEKIGNLYVKTVNTNQVLGRIISVSEEMVNRKFKYKEGDIITFKASDSNRIDVGDTRDLRIVNHYDILSMIEMGEDDKLISASNDYDEKKNVNNEDIIDKDGLDKRSDEIRKDLSKMGVKL